MKRKLRFTRASSFELVSWVIVFLLAIWAVFTVQAARNLIGSCGALATVGINYFDVLFDIDRGTPPVAFDFLDFGQVFSPIVPDVDALKNYWMSFVRILFNKTFFQYRLSMLSSNLSTFSKLMTLLVPFIPVIAIIANLYFKPNGSLPGSVSKPLSWFMAIERDVLFPIKKWIMDYYAWIKGPHRGFLLAWIAILGYKFNMVSFVLDFISYYYAFSTTFDFVILGKGLISGLVLLYPALFFFGEPGFWFLIYVIFDAIRSSIATKKQYKAHQKNMDFLDCLGVSTAVIGAPRAGKTDMVQSMTRTSEEKLRKKMRSIIQKYMNSFQDFDFVLCLKAFNVLKDSKVAVNFSQYQAWIDDRRSRFDSSKSDKEKKELIFGYDYKRKPMSFYDELEDHSIWDAIITVVCAYSVYSDPNPLITSNFPIRTSWVFSKDPTQLKKIDWKIYNRDYRKPDFFNTSYRYDENLLRVKHPVGQEIDQSTGMPMTIPLENSPITGTTEGVIIAAMEYNKSYGNRMDPGSKVRDNDGTSVALSILAHYGIIDYEETVKMFIDSQRFQDMSCRIGSRFENEIIIVSRDKKFKTFLPLWIYTRGFMEFFIKIHDKVQERFRLSRDDNTLLGYLLDKLNHIVFSRYTRRKNRWSYSKVKFYDVHHSSPDKQESSEATWTLIFKDDHAGKYKTDALRTELDSFKLAKKTTWRAGGKFGGLTVKPEDRKAMNSYFRGSMISDDDN